MFAKFELFDIVQNCDKYHYYLSLLQLPAMKISDSCVVFDFFDVLLTIVIFANNRRSRMYCTKQSGDKQSKGNNISYDAFF